MRRIATLLLVFCAIAILPACATGRATTAQIQKRASFDLDCSVNKLTVVKLDDRTRGVRGCGKRATYVEECKACANGYQACECTWVLNSDSKPAAKN